MRNKNLFDLWTLAHLALGFFLAITGASRKFNLGFAVAWEILESPFNNPSESLTNVSIDIAANVVGYEIGRACKSCMKRSDNA